MSLTSQLKNKVSPVRRFMSDAFPNTRAIVRAANAELKDAETIHPAGEVHWGTVGAAADHRIRHYFGAAHEGAAVREGARIIETGWMRGTLDEDPEEILRFADQVEVLRGTARSFFVSLDETLSRLGPWQDPRPRLDEEDERLLCRYCGVLALIEQVFRFGRIPPGSPLIEPEPAQDLSELLSRVPDAWVDDLCALSCAFHDSQGELLGEVRHVELGPTFDGSRDAGGADADMILDGLLVDVKTTITPKVTGEMIHQLLGYVLLDYSDRYGIQQVGIYLSRQRKLITWTLDALLSEAGASDGLAGLRESFADTVRE